MKPDLLLTIGMTLMVTGTIVFIVFGVAVYISMMIEILKDWLDE